MYNIFAPIMVPSTSILDGEFVTKIQSSLAPSENSMQTESH